MRIIRKPAVLERTGFGHSTLFARIADGLFPPQIKLGPRASGWVAGEVDAVIAAQVAGATDGEIRVLVEQLVERRAEVRRQTQLAALGLNSHGEAA